jgi:hypothetical protein
VRVVPRPLPSWSMSMLMHLKARINELEERIIE